MLLAASGCVVAELPSRTCFARQKCVCTRWHQTHKQFLTTTCQASLRDRSNTLEARYDFCTLSRMRQDPAWPSKSRSTGSKRRQTTSLSPTCEVTAASYSAVRLMDKATKSTATVITPSGKHVRSILASHYGWTRFASTRPIMARRVCK